MKQIFKIFPIIVVALLLAACGSQTPPAPVEITIDMAEYSFLPDTIELSVGQTVTFNLTNSGALEHELMIGRSVAQTDGSPSHYSTEFFATAGVEPTVSISEVDHGDEHDFDAMDHDMEHMDHGGEDVGFMQLVPVGDHQVTTISFTVTEDMVGDWEIGCFLLDGVHYISGMHGTLVVN